MTRLAQDLLNYLDSEEIHIADDEPDFLDRFSIWWRNVEDRWLTLPRLRAILIVGFLIFGILDLINMGIMVGTVGSVSEWNPVLRILSETGYRLGVRTSFWFGIRAILEAIVGITMIVASLLILAGRDKQGVRLGEVALIISFAVVNLFVFYFEQFSSITFAVMQFLLLLGVFNYQRRMGIQQSKRYFEE